MKDDVRTEESIVIQAPIDKVWEALTTPELIKRWFIGVDTLTDSTMGSAIVHKGEFRARLTTTRGRSWRSTRRSCLFAVIGARSRDAPTCPENYDRVLAAIRARRGDRTHDPRIQSSFRGSASNVGAELACRAAESKGSFLRDSSTTARRRCLNTDTGCKHPRERRTKWQRS